LKIKEVVVLVVARLLPVLPPEIFMNVRTSEVEMASLGNEVVLHVGNQQISKVE